MATKAKVGRVGEEDILKTLSELEMMSKGGKGPFTDPEGGLSTQGKPLSDLATGDASVNKGGDEDEDDAPQDDASGEGEGGDETPPEDDTPGDDDSSAEPVTQKSFARRARNDGTMRKSLDISPFLESLVDNMGAQFDDLAKSILGEIGATKQAADQFQVRLGMGVVMLGREQQAIRKSLSDVMDKLDKVLGQPHVPQRRAVVSARDVVQPPFAAQPAKTVAQARTNAMAKSVGAQPAARIPQGPDDNGGFVGQAVVDTGIMTDVSLDFDQNALCTLPAGVVQGWVMAKAMDGSWKEQHDGSRQWVAGLDPIYVSALEMSGTMKTHQGNTFLTCDPRVLPLQIQKAMYNDLIGGGAASE